MANSQLRLEESGGDDGINVTSRNALRSLSLKSCGINDVPPGAFRGKVILLSISVKLSCNSVFQHSVL